MRIFMAVVTKCPDTGLYVGHVPGFAGAHAQAETLDELQSSLQEVIAMLLQDGAPVSEAGWGDRTVAVVLSPQRSEVDAIADQIAGQWAADGETPESMRQALREEREARGR